MLKYLIERENEQMLRTSKRSFTFPDGNKRTLEAYRVVWTWFDRIAEAGCYTEERIIDVLPDFAKDLNLTFEEALPELIETILKAHDSCDWDLTDDTLALTMARQGLESFYLRKKLGLKRPKKIAISRKLRDKLAKKSS